VVLVAVLLLEKEKYVQHYRVFYEGGP